MANKMKLETLVGLFLILGVVLIGGLALFLTDFRTGDKNYPLYIHYKDAGGLIKGSTIRMGGAKIGVVSTQPKLSEGGDGVTLEVQINKGVRIQRGSKFHVDMQNVLGDKYIDVTPPGVPTDEFLEPGDQVSGDSESDLAKIRENALTVSTEMASLLKKLDQNSDAIVKTINDISVAAQEISEATRHINKDVLSDANLKHLSKFLANMDEGSSEAIAMIADAKKSMTAIQTFSDDARGFIGNANKKLEMLDEGLEQVAPAMRSFKTAAEGFAKLTSDINSGKGTAGMLLKDQKVKRDFEVFLRNLRDYGILRYRNPNEPDPVADPRAGYSGSRR